jgi:hypothetical protein
VSFAFHPQAAERFNQRADEFVARLSVAEPEQNSDQFKDLPVTFSLGEEDIIGISNYSTIDEAGKQTSTQFFHDGQWLGFSGDAYNDFYSFCEKVSQTGPLNGKTSTASILQQSFTWIEEKHKFTTNDTYTEHIRTQCEQAIKQRTVYFPLEGFWVRLEFEFGPFIISHCSPETYDLLIPMSDDPEKAEFIRLVRDEHREEFQGKPLARISITGDEKFAQEKARETAERIIPILNLFLGFPFLPEQSSYVAPTSFRPRPSYIFINHTSDGLENIPSGMLELMNNPTFASDALEHVRNNFSFGQVNELLKAPNTPFKRMIADSLRLMGLGCHEANVSNRLVYTMVALESLFMRNDSESIQENVGYRLAVCVVQNPDDRMNVVKNFKQAYDLRSKYIHHGRTVEIRDELKTFFMWAFIGLLAAVRNADRFSTKEDFIAQIDRKKFT